MPHLRLFWPIAALVAAAVAGGSGDREESRRGTVADRGSGRMVGLDKIRADQEGLAPVVQFLTFLQDRRGDPSHLLFVREADIEELALDSGEDATAFLGRLDQMGVIVSAN